MQSVPQTQQPPESLDGVGAGDNDQSYRFGRKPRPVDLAQRIVSAFLEGAEMREVSAQGLV